MLRLFGDTSFQKDIQPPVPLYLNQNLSFSLTNFSHNIILMHPLAFTLLADTSIILGLVDIIADDWEEMHHLANIMKQNFNRVNVLIVSNNCLTGCFSFGLKEPELDHFYGKYDSRAFLIESTRSGIQWWKRDDWKDPFRMYNPRDPNLGYQSLYPKYSRTHQTLRYADSNPLGGVLLV